MKYPNKQSGFALLTLLSLMSVGLLWQVSTQLSQIEDKVAVSDVVQSQAVLARAKQALLGYAVSYDLTNIGQLPGYLPCPDMTGNGSANPTCGNAGYSVIGCLPWRTLGLPELKDSSGTRLWYAVSGQYKNNPKKAISNHSNGLFVIEDVYGQAKDNSDITENRAIAVVFAPGKALQDQRSRGYQVDCSHADLYLDSLSNVDNATGHKSSVSGSAPGSSSLPNDLGSVFIRAAPVWAGDPRQLVFNDQLVWISPADYEPIYAKMSLWVGKKITDCINDYSQEVRDNIVAANAAAQDAWEEDYEEWEDDLEDDCRDSLEDENGNKNGWCKEDNSYYKDWILTQTPPVQPVAINENINYYPWLAPFDSTQAPIYDDEVGLRFGRIPSVLDDSRASNAAMADDWSMGASFSETCFNAASSALNADDWGWWAAWQENTFLAIHEDNTPVSTTVFDPGAPVALDPSGQAVQLSLEDNTNLMDWVLTIAGRKTDDQARESFVDRANWRNYMHCNNNQSVSSYILQEQSVVCNLGASPTAEEVTYCNNYNEYFKFPSESAQEACRIGGDIVCGRCKSDGRVICGDQNC